MVGLAVEAGLTTADVLALDVDEFTAFRDAVDARAKRLAWNNTHELLCANVEAMWGLIGLLQAGVPVVQVEQSAKPQEPRRYPRPKWVTEDQDYHDDDDVIVVTNIRDIRDAVNMMRGDPNGR